MQKIHNHLKEHSAWYAAWHKHPRHGLVHWLFFLAASSFITLFLTVQIEVSFLSTKAGGTVTLNPGDSIQAVVNANPAGTIYLFNPGIYRMQSVAPKSGDQFVGSLDAGGNRTSVLNGSRLLTAFSRETVGSASFWTASGQTQQIFGVGECDADSSACYLPEDLFFDDMPKKRVLTLAEAGAGKWYFDYASDKIYFTDDPAGHKVEIGAVSFAFRNLNASSVTIKNLVIEKYANPALLGAIQGGDTDGGLSSAFGWIVQNNDIRLNHGAGIGPVSDNWQIIGNKLRDNGQIGLTGGGRASPAFDPADNVLFENNEIYNNNWAHYKVVWEAGGLKFSFTNNLVVRNNISHHNRGPGLWTDIDNRFCLYEGNQVYDNTGEGIFHEISQDCVIRNNTLARNGLINPGWLYGANILVSTSKNTEVYGNTVEVSVSGGHGIAAINQARGTSRNGTGIYETAGLYARNNTVTYKGSIGASGGADDTVSTDNNYNRMWTGNNRFDYNVYHAPSLAERHWDWKGERDWNGFKAQGQEANGTADTNITDPVLPPPSPTPTPTSTDWTFCANEDQFCSFAGSKEVRYGANGYYAYLTLSGGTMCSNSVFGDPYVGFDKQCHFRDAAAVPPPAPPPTEPVSILSYGITGKTGTTATISWSTNITSTGLVSYGRSASSLTNSFTDGNLTNVHTVNLSGLRKATTYYYKITAVSQDGSSTASSPVASFKTNRK